MDRLMSRTFMLSRAFLFALCIIPISLFLLGTTEIKEPDAGGIGLQVVPTQRGEVVVLAVLKDSPAYLEGLKPGDLILQVDGQRLAGTDFVAVTTELLRGNVGTFVELTYQRPGVYGTFKVKLERKVFMTDPVELPGVEMRR